MTSDEEIEINLEIEKAFHAELIIIVKDIKLTLAKYIQKNVYDSFNPKEYKRHNQLINAIESAVNLNEGIIYLNPSKLNYFSAVDSAHDVSDRTVGYLNRGHSDGGTGMYHDYPSRRFFEDTVKEINIKYGANICEMIDE